MLQPHQLQILECRRSLTGGAAPVNCPLTGFLEICPCRRRRRAADSLELVRVEGGHERVLEGGILHRLAQVGVHAPRGREDALDTGGRGGRGEVLLLTNWRLLADYLRVTRLLTADAR